jgi:hypothetical protein
MALLHQALLHTSEATDLNLHRKPTSVTEHPWGFPRVFHVTAGYFRCGSLPKRKMIRRLIMLTLFCVQHALVCQNGDTHDWNSPTSIRYIQANTLYVSMLPSVLHLQHNTELKVVCHLSSEYLLFISDCMIIWLNDWLPDYPNKLMIDYSLERPSNYPTK